MRWVRPRVSTGVLLSAMVDVVASVAAERRERGETALPGVKGRRKPSAPSGDMLVVNTTKPATERKRKFMTKTTLTEEEFQNIVHPTGKATGGADKGKIYTVDRK